MQWQPIETAPENTLVLIRYFYHYKSWDRKWLISVGKLTSYGCWKDSLGTLICNTNAKNYVNLVTHWMPLPEDP